MRRFSNSLKNVAVAAPCPADWDNMIGNERIRFCGQCQLNVFNLSSMSQQEAETLIARTEGRLCVRFYRRQDGSIITKDCPVGLRALKLRASRIRRAIASSVLGFLAGTSLTLGFEKVADLLISSPYIRYHEPLQGMMIPKPDPLPPTMGETIVEPPVPTIGKTIVEPTKVRRSRGKVPPR